MKLIKTSLPFVSASMSLAAALLASSPAAAAKPPLQQVSTVTRAVGLDDDFGNADFGAGYDAGASISGYRSLVPGAVDPLTAFFILGACQQAGFDVNTQSGISACLTSASFCTANPAVCSLPMADILEAEGHLNADARLFGLQKSLVDIHGEAKSVVGHSAHSSLHYYVLGAQTYDLEEDGPLTYDTAESRQLFSASKSYGVGPVNVTLNFKVMGEIGVHIEAGATLAGLEMGVTPHAKAWGVAAASVNVLVAQGGVTANLTFLEAEVPTSGSLLPGTQAGTFAWSVDSDLDLQTLAGKVDLWGKLIGGDTHYLTVANWPGLSTTIPLVHQAGTVRLH
jgi:hypothetical protein